MEILRVFNNNLVLALDEHGRDVILTGRGLGFQARPGQQVDTSKIVRTFVPLDGRDPDHLAELLAGIPPEHIQLVSAALADVGLDAVSRTPATVSALADHVGFALRRINLGMQINYPMLAEVKHLYAEEYAQAEALVSAINVHSGVQLPQDEAVGLALHLVNVGFATGDLSYTYKMTGATSRSTRGASTSAGSSPTCATCSYVSISTSSWTPNRRWWAPPFASRFRPPPTAPSGWPACWNYAWALPSPPTRCRTWPCTSPG